MSNWWRLVNALAISGLVLLANSVTAVPPTGSVPMVNTDIMATALLVLGVILLSLEVKIVSQGILGFAGSAALVVASYLIWKDGTPFWGIPVGWVIPVIFVTILLMGFLIWLGVKSQQEKIVTGYEGYIGEIALVKKTLNPEGQVFFQGAFWQASCSVLVQAGEKVRIVGADRLMLVVEPLAVKNDG